MITIEYNPEGTPVADGKAEQFVRDLIKDLESTKQAIDNALLDDEEADVNISTSVSTENVINIARLLIARGEDIKVQFKFKGEIITPNEYGAIHNWPKGFCDFNQKWMGEILSTALAKRRAKKEIT